MSDKQILNEQKLKTFLDHRIPVAEGFTRRSAVLVPIVYLDGKMHLLLTQRALHMKHQPGDFCFPGGACEEGETPLKTALRETWEEIGVSESSIEILGEADFIVTHYGVYLNPFIGVIHEFDPDKLRLNRDEVEKILCVPLEFFMNTTPEESVIDLLPSFPPDFPYGMIHDGRNYKWGKARNRQFFYDYNGDVIWGLTARIINNLKLIFTSI